MSTLILIVLLTPPRFDSSLPAELAEAAFDTVRWLLPAKSTHTGRGASLKDGRSTRSGSTTLPAGRRPKAPDPRPIRIDRPAPRAPEVPESSPPTQPAPLDPLGREVTDGEPDGGESAGPNFLQPEIPRFVPSFGGHPGGPRCFAFPDRSWPNGDRPEVTPGQHGRLHGCR